MKENTRGTVAWLRMMRFANRSNKLSDELLKRHGLNSARFDLLAQLRQHEPITQGELAEQLVLTQGGISRMLTRLEKEGLIDRRQDWKTKTITLTAEGRSVIDRALPEQLAFQTSLFTDVLSPDELKTLNTLLTRLQKHSENLEINEGLDEGRN